MGKVINPFDIDTHIDYVQKFNPFVIDKLFRVQYQNKLVCAT